MSYIRFSYRRVNTPPQRLLRRAGGNKDVAESSRSASLVPDSAAGFFEGNQPNPLAKKPYIPTFLWTLAFFLLSTQRILSYHMFPLPLFVYGVRYPVLFVSNETLMAQQPSGGQVEPFAGAPPSGTFRHLLAVLFFIVQTKCTRYVV